MATRYGHEVLNWLQERGWQPVELPPDVYGDQWVCDPITGDEVSVYEAARRQRQRTGEYPECLS